MSAHLTVNAPIEATGLVYYPDSEPGIRRKRCGRGFSYVGPDGCRIDRGRERKRLEAMAVPPAYEDVWMSPLPEGHLMATGLDARKRKQYRYHPDWSEAQAEAKWTSMADFGAALPRIRRRVRKGLKAEPGSREFTLHAALYVIDRLAMRVGRAEYAAENGSYGALTLRRRHLFVRDDGLRLSYVAKGGLKVTRDLTDGPLADLFLTLRDGPASELFLWRDARGRSHALSPSLLNQELAALAGHRVSAKDFRTWHGSAAALGAKAANARTGIKGVAEAASKRLSNTPTVARNSYIHPAVIELATTKDELILPGAARELTRAETGLLDLIGRDVA